MGCITVVIGLAAFVMSIVVKTVLLSSVKSGLYQMRFINNAKQVHDCEHFILGDATCPGKRFEAWAMVSDAKYETCMREGAPASKSLSAASKWCGQGDPGCHKPEVCKSGEKHIYHFFSVQNPTEVLLGHKAELQESEPVSILKSVDKVQIDTSQLESSGTIEWSEAYRFQMADKSKHDESISTESLNQVLVLPNTAMFATITKNGKKVNSDTVMYLIAAAQFYTGFQGKVDQMTASLPLREFFSGPSSINFQTLVKDQFRSGRFTLALGEILASPSCNLLMPLLTAGMNSAIPAEVASQLLCHERYRGNIGLSAFSSLLKAAKLSVNPSQSPFFYEFEKGCRSKSDRPSLTCYLSTVCPYPEASPEYEACKRPSLSEDFTDKLFDFFSRISEDPPLFAKDAALGFLTSSCRVGGGLKLDPPSLCEDLIAQLMLIGRSAVTVNNPKWNELKLAYGWSSSLDSEIASKVIPYFIKGSVASLMGYGLNKPNKDPLTGGPLGPQLWVNSLMENGAVSAFTKGPFVQQVSSIHGNKGLNFFISAHGKTQSCAFDLGCMNPIPLPFDGHTCRAVPGDCEPVAVEGHGPGFFPGRLFGPVEDSHSMFLPEMFLKGNFRISQKDTEWIQSLRVDKYSIDSINFQLHGCNNFSKTSRGVDCDSPAGTKDIGFHSSYEVKMDPRFLRLPLYASFPWFQPLVESPPHSGGVYDPASKVRMIPCKSCPSSRSFSSELWTEPETGAHVYGSQKLQVNVRFRPDAVTRNVDLLLPVFWVDRADQAAPYQAAKLALIQSLPKTFNIIFAVLLAFGILMLLAGAYMVRKSFIMRRSASVFSWKNNQINRTNSAGEADSTLSSSGPQPLTSV